MSLLAALARAYDRLPDAPAYRFSSEKIGFCILLNPDGAMAEVIDLRATDKKRSPKMALVPQAVKRTAGIAPNFLWDKSAYVLGVTAGEGKRTADEHAKFRAQHLDWLEGADDPGLMALAGFLQGWAPEAFTPSLWPEEMRDQNIVFRLAGDDGYLHDRAAARALWRRIGAGGASDPQICLVTGDPGAVARLHPSIKGVWGAQSSGASLISFNLDAFTSYGHAQGDNAPVSEAAAFAYTTALNRFLEKDSGHRLQIGDASTVFWADAPDTRAAEVESIFRAYVEPPSVDDPSVLSKVRDKLDAIRNGQRLSQIAPDLEGVSFHVLGLSPNAARLSVRFYWTGNFGALTENYQRFLEDTKLEPPPRDDWPPLWRYLLELAVQGKRENVPPLVAGEWMRAILTGGHYPMPLLAGTLTRIRADGEVNALRAAMLKSVLIRNFKSKEAPVALDPANTNKGYLLGRLFAAYEQVQRAALGGNVNATIKDKFYGAASASPQKVFATLTAGAQNHFAKLRKANPGWAHNLDVLVAGIMDQMAPGDDPIPAFLSPAEQGLFGLGYYHQRSAFFRKHDDQNDDQTPETDA